MEKSRFCEPRLNSESSTQDSRGPEPFAVLLPYLAEITVALRINIECSRLLFTYFENYHAASTHHSGFMPGLQDFRIIGSA